MILRLLRWMLKVKPTEVYGGIMVTKDSFFCSHCEHCLKEQRGRELTWRERQRIQWMNCSDRWRDPAMLFIESPEAFHRRMREERQALYLAELAVKDEEIRRLREVIFQGSELVIKHMETKDHD